ncbi:MAG: hypothetical protein ACKOKG_12375, partial [Verrucomicrobiota bacterium]
MLSPLRALLLVVALMSGADAVMAQGVANLRADSFVPRDSEVELRLRFPTVFGRRYRVETSTNLLQWETTTITEAIRGPSAAVSVRGATSESRFYRVSAFDWEELRAELKVARALWQARGYREPVVTPGFNARKPLHTTRPGQISQTTCWRS